MIPQSTHLKYIQYTAKMHVIKLWLLTLRNVHYAHSQTSNYVIKDIMT